MNSPIDEFQDELLMMVFKGLSIQDLRNTRLVCTCFARIAADKELWHTVDLSDSTETTDATIEAMILQCPKLTSLKFRDFRQVTNKGLAYLAANCPALQALELVCCNQIMEINGAAGLKTGGPFFLLIQSSIFYAPMSTQAISFMFFD